MCIYTGLPGKGSRVKVNNVTDLCVHTGLPQAGHCGLGSDAAAAAVAEVLVAHSWQQAAGRSSSVPGVVLSCHVWWPGHALPQSAWPWLWHGLYL